MNKNTSAAKRVMAALLACVLALVVTGCGKHEEEDVKATVDATFAMLKSGKGGDLASYADANSTELLASYGVDANEFLAHVFSNLEYTIDEVTIEEAVVEDGVEKTPAKATVLVTVTNVNLDNALDAALAEFDVWSATDEALEVYQEGAEPALFKKLFEILYERIEALTVNKVSNQATIYLVKGEEGWDIDQDADNQAFYTALLGGGDIANL